MFQTIRTFCVTAALLALLASCASSPSSRLTPMAFDPIAYPTSPRGEVVDDYHGTPVPDPYRWLEDDDSPQTHEWIAAQNRVTQEFLGTLPLRDSIEKRLTNLWNFERFGTPYKKGSRYFYTHNTGLLNQSILYVSDNLDAPGRLLLDPNKLSADGTISVSTHVASDDGRWLAYATSDGGSDWRTIRVRNVDTGEDLPDEVKWVKFSGMSWTPDNAGFFYGRYDEPKSDDELQGVNYYQKVYYHRLGTSQSEDKLIYERPDQKEWGFGAAVTEDGRWVVYHVWQGSASANGIFYAPLNDPTNVTELISEMTSRFYLLGNEGNTFWFQTDRDAPQGRVIAIDITRPNPENWQEIIPEREQTLDEVSLIGRHFVLSSLKDVRTVVEIFDLQGNKVRDIEFPGIGSVGGFRGTEKDPETFYAFSGYTTPTTIYRYDVATGQSTVFRSPQVDFDPERFVTRQVFYRSKDGTQVPMFISHRKDLELNGDLPTYLYGYGGFNVSLTPYFSPANLVWMELGGVYVVANLRGGGEYGDKWHKAGTKLQKQNVFDDFIAAAEWLIDEGYTNPGKLAIAGGSNGGLLVGACMTQRPDLFGACVASVGVMDMLRFHKFTIGRAWTGDYGSPDDPEEFAAIYKYSPLHNLEPGTCYPPTLLLTADRDDRVVPAHSFKFAAALQAAQGCANPTLIRIETRAGHGAGKPTEKIIDEVADRWAFVLGVLGASPVEPLAP